MADVVKEEVSVSDREVVWRVRTGDGPWSYHATVLASGEVLHLESPSSEPDGSGRRRRWWRRGA